MLLVYCVPEHYYRGSFHKVHTITTIYCSSLNLGLYKANINRSKGRNRQKYIISVVLRISISYSHHWIVYLDRKYIRQIELKKPVRADRLNRHLQTFHPKAEFTFFSSAHRGFSTIVHILSDDTSLNKLKEDRNHIKHLFWTQWYETGNEL